VGELVASFWSTDAQLMPGHFRHVRVVASATATTLFRVCGMLLLTQQAVAQSTALTIVTHLSAAESDYFQHARTINQAYADRHGYSFQAVGSNHAAAADRDARWSKVKILSEVLEADTEAGGAVLWMDNDAVFTNFNYSVLSLVENMKEHRAEMAVCRDLSAPKESSRQTCSPVCLNTGTLLLLNTEWTRQLLRTWWHAADEEFPNFRHGLIAHRLRVCVSACVNANMGRGDSCTQHIIPGRDHVANLLMVGHAHVHANIII